MPPLSHSALPLAYLLSIDVRFRFPDFDLHLPMRRGVGSIHICISAREATGRNSGMSLPQPRRPRSRQPVLGQDRKKEIDVRLIFVDPDAGGEVSAMWK